MILAGSRGPRTRSWIDLKSKMARDGKGAGVTSFLGPGCFFSLDMFPPPNPILSVFSDAGSQLLQLPKPAGFAEVEPISSSKQIPASVF